MPSQTVSDGWCPFAIRKPVPSHKYWTGNKGRDAVVMHVAEGTMEGTISWFLGGSEATAHFGIGLDGALYQFVSVNDSAFGNGASYRRGRWYDPKGNLIQPGWSGMRPGENPNWYTISVEHAGYYQDSWTDAMDATNTRLLAWLAEQFPSLAPYAPGKSLIGHCDISPIDKKNCPGLRVDYARIAAAANANLAVPAVTDNGLTPDSPIISAPRATPEQAVRFMLKRPHGDYSEQDIADVILPAYWKICGQAGVDPLVAVAQMIHETGNLTSAWSQRPRRNPAGIGVTGEDGVGISFPTWETDGIPAHVGRLLAYALADQQATPTQQGLIAAALRWRPLDAKLRGVAPTLKGLEGTWAVPGDGYASKLAEIGQAIQKS